MFLDFFSVSFHISNTPRLACTEATLGAIPLGCSFTESSGTPLAAILVPLFLGLALLSLGFLLWRRFRNKESTLTERLLIKEEEVETFRKAWHIPSHEITLGECIGRGAVGEVFRAKWRDISVAVKTIKGTWLSSKEIERELDNEASMLRAVRHANVVSFFGAGSLEDGTPFLVTELMELGTLARVLKKSSVHLDWVTKKRFAREIALGMKLVHSLGRMHRDLKSSNILVTAVSGTMRVKVADFGTATLAGIAFGGNDASNMSRVHLDANKGAIPLKETTRASSSQDEGSRQRTLRTKGVGTPLWMAPEILAGESHYGPSADVYSFGIVMWEIASREEPWKNIKDNGRFMGELLETIISGQRPSVQASWPASYVDVMTRCWCTQPDARPTFAQSAVALAEDESGADNVHASGINRPWSEFELIDASNISIIS